LLTTDELSIHIRGCALNQRESQEKIYRAFYPMAMSVCSRYTSNPDDAIEILNDGFLKIFKEIHHYKPAYADEVGSFRGWLRKIMVYTAIDHYRKHNKYKITDSPEDSLTQLPDPGEGAIARLTYKEIIQLIQCLSPGYRTVLNLFIVEGLSHEEIAQALQISVGTSKSNLAKARKKLQQLFYSHNKIMITTRYAG
jgi:RNA polymerase sigma factor (sigma-70 family)